MRAALHVATVIDPGGSAAADARESYWHHATGGVYPPADLSLGEGLLCDCGLLVERDGQLLPSALLRELLDGTVETATATLARIALESTRPAQLGHDAITAEVAGALEELVPDADRREALLLALGRRFDDERHREIGNIGEELVVASARAELNQLGRPQLAREVRRVSLLSDQLGYDVSAPRTDGPARLLEVKATTSEPESAGVTIHISRNEANVGRRYADWALVVCVVDDVDERKGRILGWCDSTSIEGALPLDTPIGRWEQAALTLPLDSFLPGIPSATL